MKNNKDCYSLTQKDIKEINLEVERILNNMCINLNENKITLPNEDLIVLESALKSSLKKLKLKNKEKFTPLKYK
ncbi:hypothetical protein [Clostridium perfringens]|uniref:hypothetical protein n=1 Tax=Clostridium perfringens TaxID=1502 RepID=UPI00399D4305